MKSDFDAVFDQLCAILAPYTKTLRARHDQPAYYYLETKDKLYKAKPVFFAGVRKGKSYVSFHLMPVYAYPELRQSLSPALRKRMQGKSCFTFSSIDSDLFPELRRLKPPPASKDFPKCD